MTRSNPWGHLCVACNHLMSDHRMGAGGDLRDGPYNCLNCACAISQDSPCTPISEQSYRELRRRQRSQENPR